MEYDSFEEADNSPTPNTKFAKVPQSDKKRITIKDLDARAKKNGSSSHISLSFELTKIPVQKNKN